MFASSRGYILIGLGFGFFVFLLTQFFGRDILAWFVGFQSDAREFGVITTAVVQPFILLFESEVLVAVVASALLWPLLVIWFFLLFAFILITVGLDAISRIQVEVGWIYFRFFS